MTNSSKQNSSEEPKPKVGGINDMARSLSLRSCSGYKSRKICTPFLPKEIIFKILLCLPADILYNVMRYVCREWYNIIDDPKFVDAHLQQSPEGILMQIKYEGFYTEYAELGRNGVETTYLNLPQWGLRDGTDFGWFRPPYSEWGLELQNCCSRTLRQTATFPGMIYGCCNGLVMFADLNCFGVVYIANLILKQWISLPPIMNMLLGYYGKIGLAYAATSRKYKVVHIYSDGSRFAFEIVTVDVDMAWRYLCNVDELACMRGRVDACGILCKPPWTTSGFIHWVGYPYVLSLDVEKEIFHFSVFPVGQWDKNKTITATESYLSFMLLCGEKTWEQWALTEVETGTWLKLRTIDLSAHKNMIQSPVFDVAPIGLLENGELVCFGRFEVNGKLISPIKYFIYDVKSGRIHSFKFGGDCPADHFYRQKKSLVPVRDDCRAPA